MTVPYIAPGIPNGDEHEDLRVLDRLVADLRRYASGVLPTEAELSAAPLVERWTIVPDLSAVRLAGSIVGHPRLGDRDAVTSRVYAFDRERRWIRSYSRLWRVGQPGMTDRNVH